MTWQQSQILRYAVYSRPTTHINCKVTKNGNMDSFPLDPKNRYYRFKSFYHVGLRDYFIL